MKPKQGFTFVDLLIAIFITAIVAAILFPVFTKARERARQSSCLSNLRQLSLAVLLYNQDNDEIYPSAAAGGDRGTGVYGGWMFYRSFPADDAAKGPTPGAFEPSNGSLYPYVKKPTIYTCPDDADGKLTGDSYAYNSCLTWPSKPKKSGRGHLWPGRSSGHVSNPQLTLLFAEEGWKDTPLSTNDGLFNMSGYHAPGFDYRSYSARHVSGTNIATADGHVQYMSVTRAIALRLPTGGGSNFCGK